MATESMPGSVEQPEGVLESDAKFAIKRDLSSFSPDDIQGMLDGFRSLQASFKVEDVSVVSSEVASGEGVCGVNVSIAPDKSGLVYSGIVSRKVEGVGTNQSSGFVGEINGTLSFEEAGIDPEEIERLVNQ